MVNESDYINGYIERKPTGEYVGKLRIEGIDLSPIEGQYFKRNGESYLWIKRKKILEYDSKTLKYTPREREPMFEAYLKKGLNENIFAFVGEFIFMRFKFKIVGIWDNVIGKQNSRLNLYVDRLPMEQQTIINGLKERNKK